MTREITIIHLNDVHGYLDLHPEIFYDNGDVTYRRCGGYGRIVAFLNQIREQKGDFLLFDSGDTFHGTFPVVDTQGDILIPVLNSLNFTAMTGHWDFAYGPGKLKKLVNSLDYPFIAANVFYKDDSSPVFPAYIVREFNGLIVGITGLACNIVDKTMPASFSEGVFFTTGESELPRHIEELKTRHKADLVILLSHNGFPQDVDLAGRIHGIDLVLSGHTHNRIFTPFRINETLVVQAGSHGSFAGLMKLYIRGRKIDSFRYELHEISEKVFPDRGMQDLISRLMRPYNFLSEKAGETLTGLNRGFNLETTMDNFLLERLRNSVEADVYFSNGWRYGAPVPKGIVTLNDLYNMAPMDPVISTTLLSGSEILGMVEENLEKTFSRDPLKQMGGYVKRSLGLRVYFKAENPENSRVQYISVNGKELESEKVYKAAFLTGQGVPEKYGSERKHIGIRSVEAMRSFLGGKKYISQGICNTYVMI